MILVPPEYRLASPAGDVARRDWRPRRKAGTSVAAQALGRGKDVGAIAVRRYADLVAVEGDPLKDVTVLEKPVAVVKGGELAPSAR